MPGEIGVYQVVIRLSTEPITGIRAILLSIGDISSAANVTLPLGIDARPSVRDWQACARLRSGSRPDSRRAMRS